LARVIGELAHGDRRTYAMEGQAMQALKKIGNQFFSSIFTLIFGQHLNIRFAELKHSTKAIILK